MKSNYSDQEKCRDAFHCALLWLRKQKNPNPELLRFVIEEEEACNNLLVRGYR